MSRFAAIAVGGLVAGALDILYAFVVFGPLTAHATPVDILHSVAAGWIGRDAAAAGGVHTATLGLVTHFLIALAMADAFVTAAPAHARSQPVLWGVGYGLVLYVVMTYIVVPLSAARAGDFPADAGEALERLRQSFSGVRPASHVMLASAIFAHTILVGLPIAFANRWFDRDA